MAKVARLGQRNADDPEFIFDCPGCKEPHWFKTTGGPPRWKWNGNFDKPTVTPSIFVSASRPESLCHSFIRDGRIQFLSDCHHALAGQTVDLPEVEE